MEIQIYILSCNTFWMNLSLNCSWVFLTKKFFRPSCSYKIVLIKDNECISNRRLEKKRKKKLPPFRDDNENVHIWSFSPPSRKKMSQVYKFKRHKLCTHENMCNFNISIESTSFHVSKNSLKRRSEQLWSNKSLANVLKPELLRWLLFQVGFSNVCRRVFRHWLSKNSQMFFDSATISLRCKHRRLFLLNYGIGVDEDLWCDMEKIRNSENSELLPFLAGKSLNQAVSVSCLIFDDNIELFIFFLPYSKLERKLWTQSVRFLTLTCRRIMSAIVRQLDVEIFPSTN